LDDKSTDLIKKDIFLNSWEFFYLNNPGSKILIPYYLKTAEKILALNSKYSIEVKLSAVKFCNSILNLCYYMNDFQLPNFDETNNNNDFHHFHLVKFILILIDEIKNSSFNCCFIV
jgi:hypothetical protein